MNQTHTEGGKGGGLVSADRATLVVIDIQSKTGEAMPAKVANRVILNTILLARAASELNVPTILTEQEPAMLGDTYSDIRAAVADGTRTFDKTAFSAARDERFMSALGPASGARDQVILVGMEAHIAVLQTAFDLAEAGYEVLVTEDGVCSRRLENYQNALDRLRQSGIQVASAESLVFEWLRDQVHPAFKTVQTWLR